MKNIERNNKLLERKYKLLVYIVCGLCGVLALVYVTLRAKIDMIRLHTNLYATVIMLAVVIGILSVTLLPTIIEKIETRKEKKMAAEEAALAIAAQKAADEAKRAEREAALIESVNKLTAEVEALKEKS